MLVLLFILSRRDSELLRRRKGAIKRGADLCRESKEWVLGLPNVLSIQLPKLGKELEPTSWAHKRAAQGA